MSYDEIIRSCAKNRQFVESFDTLTGSNLYRLGNSLVDMLFNQEALKQDPDLTLFVSFVFATQSKIYANEPQPVL